MDQENRPPAAALQEECVQKVMAIFPDICPDYLHSIAGPHNYVVDAIICNIVDTGEDGQSYPKKAPAGIRKRKRDDNDEGHNDANDEDVDDDDDDEESLAAKRKYDFRARKIELNGHQLSQIQDLINNDFPKVPRQEIERLILDNRHALFPSYLALSKVIDTWDDQNPPWCMEHASFRPDERLNSEHLALAIENSVDPKRKNLLKELQAVRLVRSKRQERRAKIIKEEADPKNMAECECCFGEHRISCMVRCQGDPVHLFCINCARRSAEEQIGLSRYELTCLSMDDCAAGFAYSERKKFLRAKMTEALDRIEQETVLRLAEIENLEKCPFCPYAEEYPPIEVDKEFRCRDPKCEIVSCRKCKQKTHLPSSCIEAASRNGIPARRQIEEAMSDAVIRRCNRCQTPFIKEYGCNKMACTQKGCRNIQCYVCSKSCGYSHFNDKTRGGKEGNCPLFDSVEVRHEEEIRKAEDEARKRITEDNPGVNPEHLQIQMSKKVTQDDERRKKGDPYLNQDQLYIGDRRMRRFREVDIFPDPPYQAQGINAPVRGNFEAWMNGRDDPEALHNVMQQPINGGILADARERLYRPARFFRNGFVHREPRDNGLPAAAPQVHPIGRVPAPAPAPAPAPVPAPAQAPAPAPAADPLINGAQNPLLLRRFGNYNPAHPARPLEHLQPAYGPLFPIQDLNLPFHVPLPFQQENMFPMPDVAPLPDLMVPQHVPFDHHLLEYRLAQEQGRLNPHARRFRTAAPEQQSRAVNPADGDVG